MTDDDRLIWSRAIVRLSTGSFAEGWLDYERRWKSLSISPRPFALPVWDGTPLNDDWLLVYAEQGIGDEIFFENHGVLTAYQSKKSVFMVKILAMYLRRLIIKSTAL